MQVAVLGAGEPGQVLVGAGLTAMIAERPEQVQCERIVRVGLARVI